MVKAKTNDLDGLRQRYGTDWSIWPSRHRTMVVASRRRVLSEGEQERGLTQTLIEDTPVRLAEQLADQRRIEAAGPFYSTAGEETFTLGVPAEDTSVRRVRRTLVEALRTWDMAELIDDATLIVSELVTNGIAATIRARRDGVPLHQSDEEADIYVWVCLRRGGELSICVRDHCDDPPAMRDEAGMDESGRGLVLVNALARAWGCKPMPGGGKQVWAVIDLPKP